MPQCPKCSGEITWRIGDLRAYCQENMHVFIIESELDWQQFFPASAPLPRPECEFCYDILPSHKSNCRLRDADKCEGGECDDSVGYLCNKHADKLLPCPFCGSNDLKLDNLADSDDYFVSCGKCEVQQIANYTPEVAIKRWNNRILLPNGCGQ